MLGTLVAGRISIAAASVSAAKTGLAIAVRYSDRRRQFGPDGGPEVPILDYPVHQKLLLPSVARTYALHFAVRELVDRYDAALGLQRETGGLPGDEMREVEAGAAALKALASWHGLDALQAAREAMGGRGYTPPTASGASGPTPTSSPPSRGPTPFSCSWWPRPS